MNDSFILSPTKKLDLGPDTPPGKTSNSKDENHRNLHEKDSGIGTEPIVIRNFSENNHEDHLKMSYRPLKSRTQLFPSKLVLHERTQEPSIPSVFQKSEKDEPEPAVSEIVENVNTMELIQKIPVVNETETPFKKTDQLHVFATPSLRPTTFSSTTSNTNFTRQPLTCERKDKPKVKILFTTPIARPPPGSLLETTPIDTRKGALQTLRKLSPIKEPSAEKENSNERLLSINNVDYVIGRKIGSGGSSSVFLGRGKNSGKECAIKLVNLDGDQQVIDGYLNETKLLAKLQGNVSVVSLFDYCHLPKKNILYMVMEKGESDLHKILQAFTTHIPLYTLMNYWYQMLAAVHYIHLNGVIHSDLKPANFLMIGGRLKLIDFGIASNIALDSTSIIKFSQAGTFNYISPEALIDTSTGDSPSTHHQPRIRLSTKSDVSFFEIYSYLFLFNSVFSRYRYGHLAASSTFCYLRKHLFRTSRSYIIKSQH